MKWLNLELSTLENDVFGVAETVEVGAWLRLTRYCCGQENGGRIKGARAWDDRKWIVLCRITKAEIDRACPLWAWKGPDLIVNYFPSEHMRTMKRLRSQARDAANSRWEKERARRDAERMPDGMPAGTKSDASGNAKDKGKSKDKDKGKEKERGRDAHSLVADNPPSPEAVVAYFATSGVPADVAADFRCHFAANGWKQGRAGSPLVAWEPEAEKWARRWKRDSAASEKSSVAAATAGGGVPVLN